MRDSWSWTSSNFYPKDVMDLSYTDPLFHPIYSLQGISQSLLEVKTRWFVYAEDQWLCCVFLSTLFLEAKCLWFGGELTK